MKTLDDYEYDYFERMGIILEDSSDEDAAHETAIWQVRREMAENGIDWGLEPRIGALKGKWARGI